MRRTIRLRPDFDQIAKERGAAAPLWRDMGVDRSTLHRVRTGETRPSNEFIAGALAALAPAKFDDLFEVVTTQQ